MPANQIDLVTDPDRADPNTLFADNYTATDEITVVIGHEGDNLIRGNGFANTLFGDWFSGRLGFGDDSLFGGAGRDDLIGMGGNDDLYGGGGNDQLWAFHYDNRDPDSPGEVNSLSGDGGNDFLYGGNGIDHLFGGAGADVIYSYHARTSNTALHGILDDSPNTMDGGAGDDFLFGGNESDVARIGQGNDSAFLADGDDRITVQGTGDSSLYGGDGADLLRIDGRATGTLLFDGGADGDIARLTAFRGDVSVLAGAGRDKIFSGAGNDRLQGGRGDDDLRGGGGDDSVEGGQGDDGLEGGAGFDELYGGAGDDFLSAGDDARGDLNGYYGGAGEDVIGGGRGSDELAGGEGIDFVNGRGGFDVFVVMAGEENKDILSDFEHGLDAIELSRDEFGGLAKGRSMMKRMFADGFGDVDEDTRIIYDRRRGEIYHDPDGAGGAEAEIFAEVNAGLRLTADDFFVS